MGCNAIYNFTTLLFRKNGIFLKSVKMLHKNPTFLTSIHIKIITKALIVLYLKASELSMFV